MNPMEAQRHPELQPSNMEASVAVLAVEMRVIREGVEELKAGQHQNLPRLEWEQWKQMVEKDLIGIRQEIASRRVPWTSVGAFIVAGTVLLLQLIEKFGT